MTRLPNPLTDELTDEAKAELAAKFAEMRERERRNAEFIRRRQDAAASRPRRPATSSRHWLY